MTSRAEPCQLEGQRRISRLSTIQCINNDNINWYRCAASRDTLYFVRTSQLHFPIGTLRRLWLHLKSAASCTVNGGVQTCVRVKLHLKSCKANFQECARGSMELGGCSGASAKSVTSADAHGGKVQTRPRVMPMRCHPLCSARPK